LVAAAAVLLAAGAAAVWFPALGRRGGAGNLLAYASPDATLVASIDAAKLRQSELYKRVREKLGQVEQSLGAELKCLKLTFDDVDSLMAAGSLGEDEAAVIAVRTARATRSLEEVLASPERAKREEVEGYEAAVVADGLKQRAVARVSRRVLCLAPSREGLAAVLRRARGAEKPRVNAEMEELLNAARRFDHVVMLSGLAGALGKAELLLPRQLVADLASVRGVGIGFSVSSSIDIEVRARLAYPDQAARLSGDLQKGVREGIANLEGAKPKLSGDALASAEQGLALLRSVRVSQQDALVCVAARLDEQMTSSLVGPLAAGLARSQEHAQLAANLANLKQIGLASVAYETQKKVLPKSLTELVEAGLLTDKALLVSPLDKAPPVTDDGVPCSYGSSLDHFGGQRRPAPELAQLPLAWDRVAFLPDKRSVVFYDGRVETVGEVRLGALMRQLDAVAAGKGRPALPFPKLPQPKGPFAKQPAPGQVDTPLVGGARGTPFRLVGPGGEPLLGVRCTTRSWMREDCLGMLEALFAEAPAGPLTAVAKPGYAVGAIEVDAAAHVNAVQLVFMRLEDRKLNPADSYRSDWLGKPTGRATKLTDGKGAKVVGLCGRRTLTVEAIGLVTVPDAKP
jgi:hypothetical protein